MTLEQKDFAMIALNNMDVALNLYERLETSKKIIRDLLPYATASIGLPRTSWPHDSVILQAEKFLEEEKIP